MFKSISVFSGFSVLDIEKTKSFYSKTLGLEVEENKMGLQLKVPGGASIFIYPKANHQPATYTILNFAVENIDLSLEELATKGVKFIHYENKEMPQDEKGVLRGLSAGMGPDIAWFEDPSGNILSILQEK